MFDKIYEKFKRFCTEWDEPETESGLPDIPTDYETDITEQSAFTEEDATEEPTYSEPAFTDDSKTSYFSIEELCYSQKALVLGIGNKPSETVKQNLQELIDNVLDPLRRAYGKPITVNSGYRCTALNLAVGGVSNSQHLTGHAADITGGSKAENRKLWELIRQLNLPIDQCINESGFTWVHVSYDKTRNRRMFLTL